MNSYVFNIYVRAIRGKGNSVCNYVKNRGELKLYKAKIPIYEEELFRKFKYEVDARNFEYKLEVKKGYFYFIFK